MISPVFFRTSGRVRVKSEHQVSRAGTESFPAPCRHHNNDDSPSIFESRSLAAKQLLVTFSYEPNAHRRVVVSSTAHLLKCLGAISVRTIILDRKDCRIMLTNRRSALIVLQGLLPGYIDLLICTRCTQLRRKELY